MLGLRLQKRRGAHTPQPLSGEERRFARGTRTLADLLAPAAVEVARNHVRLEYQYARVLVVVGYPRTVAAGWLAPLLEFEHPIEISLHVHPLETASIVKLLGHKLVQLQSSRLVEVRGGRLADPEREVAFEEPAEDWAKEGIATYAFDQRGFGHTEYRGLWAGDHRMVADVKAAVQILRQREPKVPFYLLGESMGGAVVMSAMVDSDPPKADGLILVEVDLAIPE